MEYRLKVNEEGEKSLAPDQLKPTEKEEAKALTKQLKKEQSDQESEGKNDADDIAALAEDIGGGSDKFIYKIFYKNEEIERTRDL